MFYTQMIRDGLAHGRWSMIDLHIGLLGILPEGVGFLLTSWGMSFMMATWRGLFSWRMTYLGGETFYTLKEGIKPYIAYGS
jgi:hypothetical protein